MRLIAFTAVAALSLATLAEAQNFQIGSVTAAARDVYASCLSMSARENTPNAAAACACVTGYMGGALNDRDFEVASILLRVGEMSERGAPQSAIETEVIAFLERGFTESDIDRVSATIQEISRRGDAVCSQLQNPGSV